MSLTSSALIGVGLIRLEASNGGLTDTVVVVVGGDGVVIGSSEPSCNTKNFDLCGYVNYSDENVFFLILCCEFL